jgi:hypothetical protein
MEGARTLENAHLLTPGPERTLIPLPTRRQISQSEYENKVYYQNGVKTHDIAAGSNGPTPTL